MSGRLRTMAIAVAGVLVGAVAMLALPAPGGSPPSDERERPAPVADKVKPETLLAWTPSRLPDGFADRAARVPGVRAVTEVRSDTVWLDAWSTSDGRESRPSDGFRVPVEVAALDTSTYLDFVPPAQSALFASFRDEGIVLGATGWNMRGMDAGGSLRFGEVRLEVLAAVPDSMIGAHEAAVSIETGQRLGIRRPRYVLLALDEGASRADVERDLKKLVPPGTPMRVRAPGETPEFRHGDAVLAPARLKELFGEFTAAPSGPVDLRIDPDWVRDHIVTERMPVVGTVRCHAAIAPQLRAALNEIVRRGLDDLLDQNDFGGCFVPRRIRHDPGAGISHHTWGIALDFNVSQNPVGREPRMDRRIVDVFERWGFTWGGRWLVPDPMQFEFVRFPLSPKG